MSGANDGLSGANHLLGYDMPGESIFGDAILGYLLFSACGYNCVMETPCTTHIKDSNVHKNSNLDCLSEENLREWKLGLSMIEWLVEDWCG